MMTEIPPAILKNPPHRIFAYIHSQPAGQVMGVAVDSITGKVIEAVILPTRQRVMLGLGIGDDKAHAHHKYRRKYPRGYQLLWTENPETDERLASLKGRLEKDAGELRERAVHVTESDARRSGPITQEGEGTLAPVGELTAELVRAGAEEARTRNTPSQQQAVGSSSGPSPDRDKGQDKPKPDHGGFF